MKELNLKFEGLDNKALENAVEMQEKILAVMKENGITNFKTESGTIDTLTAGVSITFAKSGTLKYNSKIYQIEDNKTGGIILYPVSMSNGAAEISLNSLSEIAKQLHAGTNKCQQAEALCKALAGRTLYVKSVYYEYIMNTKTNKAFAIRHIEYTDKATEITEEDILTSNANIEAYKEANKNHDFSELYEKQELAKQQPTVVTRGRDKNK